MKIAVVSHDSFWPLKGGGGIRVYWVVKKLIEKGHEVTVVAPFNDLQGFKEEFPTIKVKNLGQFSRFSKYKELQYSKLTIKILFSLLMLKLDGIYAHNIVAAWPSYLISKIKKIPIIFDMDDILTGLSKNKSIQTIGKKIEFFVAKQATCLIVMSQSLKKELIKTDITREIHVVFHGVNLSKFYPKGIQKKDKIIYTGGIESHDGTVLIPESALIIFKNYPNIKFEIIGDGSQLTNLITLVEKNHIIKNFNFITWVDHEKIPDYLDEAQIGIITHFRTLATEICLVLKGLEYMAMGLPVVAPDLPGMREEFGNNERGLLFEPDNPRDFAKKILTLLSDEQLRIKLGKAGMEFVKQNCNWEENAKKIVEISEDCINKHKKH